MTFLDSLSPDEFSQIVWTCFAGGVILISILFGDK